MGDRFVGYTGQACRFPKAGIVGTWHARLADASDRSAGRVYTFTADGRVTMAPGQSCRYRIAAEALAVDCAGAARDSAEGRLVRRGTDTLIWTVDGRAVRLERAAGVSER